MFNFTYSNVSQNPKAAAQGNSGGGRGDRSGAAKGEEEAVIARGKIYQTKKGDEKEYEAPRTCSSDRRRGFTGEGRWVWKQVLDL